MNIIVSKYRFGLLRVTQIGGTNFPWSPLKQVNKHFINKNKTSVHTCTCLRTRP